MTPRIFITGATGYIGGQFLEILISKHPDYDITALVRDSSKAAQLFERHPSLQLVIGDLNSTSLLTEKSKLSDIVIQTADADHSSGISAIIQGLSDLSRPQKGSLIQLSGAASTIDISTGYGQPSSKVWSDITDIHTITHFPHTTTHALTDQLVLNSGHKTAILEPPMVYGKSEGVKKFSMGLPWMIDAVKKRGKVFMIDEGKHLVTAIHVKDIAKVMVLLVEDAVSGEEKMTWGQEGVYYVEGGEYIFQDVVERITREVFQRGLVNSRDIEKISAEHAAEIHPWGGIMWGANMRTRASRLKGFGWEAQEDGLIDSVPELFT